MAVVDSTDSVLVPAAVPAAPALSANGSPSVAGAVTPVAKDETEDDLVGDDDTPGDEKEVGDFEEVKEDSDTGFQDELDDDDDDLDEFDDIDEDDFDDNFDDDFEEELEDDYEIEIEDEISAEFGLGSSAGKEPEIEDGLEDFEDFDNVE